MRVVRVQWRSTGLRMGGMQVPCFDPLSVLEERPDPTVDYRVLRRIPPLAETMARYAGALALLADAG